jgi:2-polyprenyl-3-methyl-5-hydroxy-6-metoxy-1,4-benzoquinol methylase
MNYNLKLHWEKIYDEKNEDEVSWFQKETNESIKMIQSAGIENPKIIDVGSGRSKLLKNLIEIGYNHLTYLDISESALEKSKEFLGEQSNKGRWISKDIVSFMTDEKFDIWHDRAVFHFLNEENLIRKYIEIVEKNISESGHLIIGTFSENGPLKCSGLEVRRYSEKVIEKLFNRSFKLIDSFYYDHVTPFNTTQNFLFSHFIKK